MLKNSHSCCLQEPEAEEDEEEDLLDLLARATDEVAERNVAEQGEGEAADREALGRRSSSSSSTSSSSSSSSSKPEGGPGRGGPDIVIRQHSAQDREDIAQREANSAPQRQVQLGTHHWGPFLLTWVPAKPSSLNNRAAPKARWQATCKHHASYSAEGVVKTKCTRSMIVEQNSPQSDSSQRVLRILKTWLVQASQYSSKVEHQAVPTPEAKTDEELEALLRSMEAPPQKPQGSTPKKSDRKRKREEP